MNEPSREDVVDAIYALSRFQDTAAAFYAACPWATIDEGLPLGITFEEDGTRLIAVLVGRNSDRPGLCVYEDLSAVRQAYAEGPRYAPPELPRLLMEFSSIDENREVVDGVEYGVARPGAARILTDECETGATPAELHLLAKVMTVLTIFVDERRTEIPRWAAIRARFNDARVTFPADFDVDDTQFIVTAPGAAHRTPELCTMRDRVFELPQTRAVMRRWAWTFFKDGQPRYARDGLPRQQALARFLDWSMFFAAPPGGPTLAETALAEMITRGVPADEIAFWQRFAHPRHVFGEVIARLPGYGYRFRNQLDNSEGIVRDAVASYRLSVGWFFAGPLFPVGNNVYSTEVVHLYQHALPLEDEVDNVWAAPSLEMYFHGADTAWIQEAPLDELQQAYEEFNASIGEMMMPPFDTARRFAQVSAPEILIDMCLRQGPWWSRDEQEVMAAFWYALASL